MRRKDREITGQDELLAIIEQCDVCRLAIQDEGCPYIVPLNFGVEVRDGQVVLYFHSAPAGTKCRLLAQNGYVSFEMDCGHALFLDEAKGSCNMAYQSVIGRGLVTPVPAERKLHALRVLLRHYRQEDFPFSEEAAARTAVYQLAVEQMTGKACRRA